MKLLFEIVGASVVAGAVVVVMVLLFTFPTMWLWNWLLPYIFGLPTIDFWQAMGLLALASLLRGGGNTGSK